MLIVGVNPREDAIKIAFWERIYIPGFGVGKCQPRLTYGVAVAIHQGPKPNDTD